MKMMHWQRWEKYLNPISENELFMNNETSPHAKVWGLVLMCLIGPKWSEVIKKRTSLKLVQSIPNK